MNNLNNINTLQNLTDITYLTSYTNEYLISALANLGQRNSIKDNYIVYENCKLEEILPETEGEGVYCMKIQNTLSENSSLNNLSVKYLHFNKKEDFSIYDVNEALNSNAKTLFTDINFSKIYDFTLYNSINNVDSYDLYFSQENQYLNIYFIGYLNNEPVEYAYYQFDISSKKSENSSYKILKGLIYYNIALYTTGNYQSYWTRIYFENADNIENGLDSISEKIDFDDNDIKSYYLYCVDSDYYHQNEEEIIVVQESTETGIKECKYYQNEYIVKHYLAKDKIDEYIDNQGSFIEVLTALVTNNIKLAEYNPEVNGYIRDEIINHIDSNKVFNPVTPFGYEEQTIIGETNIIYTQKYTISAFCINELNNTIQELYYDRFIDIEEVSKIQSIIEKEYLHLDNLLIDTYYNNKFSSNTEVIKYILYKLIEKSLENLPSNSFVILNKDFSIKYIHDKSNLLYIYSLLNYFHTEFYSSQETKYLYDYSNYDQYNNYLYCWNPISANIDEIKTNYICNQNKINIYNIEINNTNTNYDNVIHGFSVNKVYTLPYIDKNGEWIINDIETNYTSVGQDSGNPNMFYIIQENNWEKKQKTVSSVTAYFNEELSKYFNYSYNNSYSSLIPTQTEDYVLPTKENFKYYEKLLNYLSCTHISHNSYEGETYTDNYEITFWNYNTNNIENPNGQLNTLWKSINTSNGKPLTLTVLSSLSHYINKVITKENNAITDIIKDNLDSALSSYIGNNINLSSKISYTVSNYFNDKTQFVTSGSSYYFTDYVKKEIYNNSLFIDSVKRITPDIIKDIVNSKIEEPIEKYQNKVDTLSSTINNLSYTVDNLSYESSYYLSVISNYDIINNRQSDLDKKLSEISYELYKNSINLSTTSDKITENYKLAHNEIEECKKIIYATNGNISKLNNDLLNLQNKYDNTFESLKKEYDKKFIDIRNDIEEKYSYIIDLLKAYIPNIKL